MAKRKTHCKRGHSFALRANLNRRAKDPNACCAICHSIRERDRYRQRRLAEGHVVRAYLKPDFVMEPAQ